MARRKPKANNYAVWVDGCDLGDHRLGAGWVVNQGGRHLRGESCPLDIRGNATLAEIEAARAALESLPRYSRVTLYTDCSTLTHYFDRKFIPLATPQTARHRERLHDSLSRFFEAVSQHRQVTVTQVPRESERLREAHHLARAAAQTPRGRISTAGTTQRNEAPGLFPG